jgi:hypothetical protein
LFDVLKGCAGHQQGEIYLFMPNNDICFALLYDPSINFESKLIDDVYPNMFEMPFSI